jgi:hypothetical protein
MKPGERIRLIKDAASSLSSRPVAEIQLTLQEFGVETWHYVESDLDSFTYCTRQLQACDDDVLVSVQEFLNGEDAAPVESQVLWGPEPGRAFLSHVHENREFAGEVKGFLPHFGISGFVAHADINPSKQWRGAIKEALATCHIFVAFIDDGFHQSQWCDQEVGWALSRDIPILPVRPRDFDRSAVRKDGFLEEHQDVFLDDASGRLSYWIAEQVFNSFVTHARTREVGVMALAEAFVNSGSFDQTRRLWSIIERQTLIESPQLRRLEYAVQTNRQVYEAVVPHKGQVPQLVRELVQTFEPSLSSRYGFDEEPF